MFDTPLTITLPYLWDESPFSWWIRIVVTVELVLEIDGKVSVPPDELPIYPIALLPEHPEQVTTLAPPARIFELASASTIVSEGPTDQVPADGFIIQLT
jgi:hypothetical protein